ncbi:MAG: response regulator transcription factor [Chitinophagaceae bacterium]|nr:response regulator transcription factor [Chitinophagaceae bacterium]
MTINSINAILVDDEQRGINALQKLIELHCPQVSIIASFNDPSIVSSRISSLKPDLVFLDIAMPDKNGFEILKEIPVIDFEIIFVTAHNQFALQAFHFSAVDYLLKPVDSDLLKAAVLRAGQRLADKSNNRNLETLVFNTQQNRMMPEMKLCIPSLKGFQVINIRDIVFCEAASNYTNFHLLDRSTICASKPIQEYEELLEDAGLLRTHKSFLINMAHIKEYLRGEGGTVLLTNNVEVEVSRRRKEYFINKMKEYFKY